MAALGPPPAWVETVSGASTDLAATLLLIVCVGMVFCFVPNVRVRFRDVWPGAVLTGLLWRLAFSLFSAYAADPAQWSVHGSVAAVVVFLLWIYVSAVLLLYGVEMTAAYVRLREAALRQRPRCRGQPRRAISCRISAAVRNGRSSDLREVIRLPSSTTGRST